MSDSERMELKNVQATVKEQQEEQKLNAEKADELLEVMKSDIGDYDPLEWSVEKLSNVIPAIGGSQQDLSAVKSKWNTVYTIVKDGKTKLKDLLDKCVECSAQFKSLKQGSVIGNLSQTNNGAKQSLTISKVPLQIEKQSFERLKMTRTNLQISWSNV